MNLKIGDNVEVFTLSFGTIAKGIITKVDENKVYIRNSHGKETWYYKVNVFKDEGKKI